MASGRAAPPGGSDIDGAPIDEFGSQADSEVASSNGQQDSTQAILRILAETQRMMLQNQQGGMNKARILANVRIPPFDGAEQTTARQYQEWRKNLDIVRRLNNLTDQELAMLIYTQVTNRAKQLIEVLEGSDFKDDDSLETIWNIYDDAFEKMAHERLDDVLARWETAHRKPGQPMQDWCIYLRKMRLEVQVQDGTTVISDRTLASKMLRGSGLPRQQRSQVLFNCGGLYESTRMETVLKATYGTIQHSERRTGQVLPRRGEHRHQPQDRGYSSTRPPAARAPWRPARSRHVHEADLVEEENDGEDHWTNEDEVDDEDDNGEVFAGEVAEETPEAPFGVAPPGPDDEEIGEDTETEETLTEAFLAGWRAKQKTASLRTRRGFVPPKTRPTANGSEPDARSQRAQSLASKDDQKKNIDPRKAKSRCAGCKQLGHWKGDPQCPEVQAGRQPPFKPAERTGNTPGANSARPARTYGPVLNWVGMVGTIADDDKDKTDDMIEIIGVTRNYRKDTHLVRLDFRDPQMAKHIYDRISQGKGLWFKQGNADAIWRVGGSEHLVELAVTCPGVRGRDFDEEDVRQVLFKILKNGKDAGKQQDVKQKKETRHRPASRTDAATASARPRESSEQHRGRQRSRHDRERRERPKKTATEHSRSRQHDKQPKTICRYDPLLKRSPGMPRKMPPPPEEVKEPKRKRWSEQMEEEDDSEYEEYTDAEEVATSRVVSRKSASSGVATPVRDGQNQEGDRQEQAPPQEAASSAYPGTTAVPKALPVVRQELLAPKTELEEPGCSLPPNVKAFIKKWIDKQDMFDEYVVKPACIHVLYQNQVKRFNLWTLKCEEPTPIQAGEVSARANAVFMVTQPTETADASTSVTGSIFVASQPQQEAADSAAEAAGIGAGSSTQRDSEMRQAGEPEEVDEASRERKAKDRKELQKVAEEKEELLEKLRALQIKEDEMTKKVTGKDVYDKLKDRRLASGGKPAKSLPTDPEGGVSSLWSNLRDTRRTAARVPETVTKLESGPRVEAPSGKTYVMTGASSAGTRADPTDKQVMRRDMYEKQVESGTFKPGPKSKYDPQRMQEQVKCKHPFETLRWGGNKTSVYASCTKCGLKSCILYHALHVPVPAAEDDRSSVFMVGDDQVNASFEVRLPRGLVMADTGCRRAVGGTDWHRELQEELDAKGVSYSFTGVRELFQFGPGEPILSSRRWVYPVGILGSNETLQIAEVDAAIPGLVGPDEMANWGVSLDFRDGSITTRNGTSQLHSSMTGHPCISLMDYAAPEQQEQQVHTAEVHDTEPAPQIENPQTPNFFIGDDDDMYASDNETDSGTDPEMPPLIGSSDEEPEPQGFDSGSNYDSSDTESTHAHTSDEELSAEESDKSFDRESFDGESVFEVHPVELEKFMTKGARRHVRSNVSELTSFAEQIAQEKMQVKKESPEVCLEPPSRPKARRPGPWRCMEIFTWLCMVTTVAFDRGWDSFQPVTLPDFDLQTEIGRQEARGYIKETDPDLLVIAFRCTPWSQMQQINQRTPHQVRRLRLDRLKELCILEFVNELAQWQASRGRAVVVENPKRSLAWETIPMKNLRSHPLIVETITDMCCYNKRRPDNGMLVRKPTKLVGTKQVLEKLSWICNGTHDHDPIEGSMKIPQANGTTKSMHVNAWAGGYTKDFASQMLQGAEEFLIEKFGNQSAHSNFPTEADVDMPTAQGEAVALGPTVPEETAMQPDVDEDKGDYDIGNWSEEELPQDKRGDLLIKVPKDVRQSVRRAHRGLGHPTRKAFLKMMRLGNASEVALEYAKWWKCPTCEASAMPAEPLESSTRLRPFGFNMSIGLDVKYLKDAAHKQFVALSIVDYGTSWHMASFLKNRTPKHVAKVFFKDWIAHYGVPDEIVIDQGGEFQGYLNSFMEQYGIDSRAVGANAAWQHGVVERHGGLLGTMWRKLVYEHDVKGIGMATIALSAIINAKNSTMSRNGMTPEQAVFGRSLKFTELSNTDDDEVMMSVLGSHGLAWKASQIRTAAKVMLLRNDALDKVRRAMLRQAPTVIGEVLPGSRVYFWSANPMKGRRRQDAERWRGPATVIARESQGRYYLSWRGTVLLVAKEQMRYATTLETAAADKIAKDLNLTAQKDNKSYLDVSDQGAKPKIDKRRVKKDFLKKDSRKTKVRPQPTPLNPEAKRAIRNVTGDEQPRLQPQGEEKNIPAWIQPLEDIIESQPQVQEGEQEAMPQDVPNATDVQELLALADRPASYNQLKRKSYNALDDVPLSMKRGRYQSDPAGAQQLPLVAMNAVIRPQSEEWFDKYQIGGLSTLMNKVVRGVRVHSQPRRKLFDHPRHRNFNRLTVMITESGAVNVKDDGIDRESQKMPNDWCGLTVFYHDKPGYHDIKGTYFLDTPRGLIRTPLTHEELQNVTAVYAAWKHNVYSLVLKSSQKELNPKYFDHKEKQQFDFADWQEWKQWVANRAVDIVPAGEERNIPSELIIAAPMRFVRTNRGKESDELEAKSRLVIPGHTDPQLGLYRTDAPTTSHLAVMMCAIVSVALEWSLETFDVTTAFLSGMAMSRELYTKAPAEGLPATDSTPTIAPYSLLKVLKGAYGLTEAPRLWYLRAKQILVDKIGFEELRCARATFTYRYKGELKVLLNLHVDDGMMAGNFEDPTYQMVKAKVNQHFKIKQWKTVTEKDDLDYIGMQWRFVRGDGEKRELVIHMNRYIDAIPQIPVGRKDDDQRELTKEELTQFKSHLAKARWPIARVAPQLAYSVSALAQGGDGKQLSHVKALNELIDRLQALRHDNGAQMRISPVNLTQANVVTVMDASFGNEEGRKSQCGFLNLITETTITKGPATCNVAEFQSSTIGRVVRSTMAAEAAALSTALDRHLFLRLMLECVLYGEPELAGQWRHKLRIPGILVTDSKSLYDHLITTGSVPTERQTLIDLLVARDLHENGAVAMKWLPNRHMVADVLTKALTPNEVYNDLVRLNRYSLVPTDAQVTEETHRQELRRGQRQRAKERKETRRR